MSFTVRTIAPPREGFCAVAIEGAAHGEKVASAKSRARRVVTGLPLGAKPRSERKQRNVLHAVVGICEFCFLHRGTTNDRRLGEIDAPMPQSAIRTLMAIVLQIARPAVIRMTATPTTFARRFQ